ncbi:MAG: 3-oxoacyl-[acyl-carrier-protein] synthase III C-terminal domain-containing protein [Solirubrobacteraceae bacterium]
MPARPTSRTDDQACISGLALANPETAYTQDEVLALLGLTGDEFAQRIFHRGGIQRRRLDLKPELLGTTLQGRSSEIEEQLTEYAVRAVEGLGVDPSEIGTVITSSLYSLGCPTLAHRLAERMEIDPAADRYHVLGVGCASAIPLVRLAQQSLSGSPGKKALIVAAESMSGIMMSASDDDPRSKTVASSLFGDGCAAMLLEPSTAADGPIVLASKVHQIAGTLEAVTLDFSAHDSHLRLIKELPDVAGKHLHGLVSDFLATNDLSAGEIDHWLIHPGGRRIIESVQDALGLADEHVRISFEVLANHGNVGTPSIFYVMHRTIEQRDLSPGEHGLMVTIGPGVSVGLMLLRW